MISQSLLGFQCFSLASWEGAFKQPINLAKISSWRLNYIRKHINQSAMQGREVYFKDSSVNFRASLWGNHAFHCLEISIPLLLFQVLFQVLKSWAMDGREPADEIKFTMNFGWFLVCEAMFGNRRTTMNMQKKIILFMVVH